jgi:hypothetical protein
MNVAVAAEYVIGFADTELCSPAEASGPRWSDPQTILARSGHGVVGPSGTMVVGGQLGSQFAVAVSHDSAANWAARTVPGSRVESRRSAAPALGRRGSRRALENSVAVDADGAIYAMWPDPRGMLYAAWSSDGGTRWSGPVVVSAPTLRTARFGAIVAADSGRIAIAYVGREKGRIRPSAYLFECKDFSVEDPVFVGGRFDDADRPIDIRGSARSGLALGFDVDGDVTVSAVVRTRWAQRIRRFGHSAGIRSAAARTVVAGLARRRE